jgi:FdhD protein
MSGRTARRLVRRIGIDSPRPVQRADILAAEEPLGIRIGGQAVTLTMRTPGDDLDLTAGFLFGEGIISSADDIVSMQICGASCGHTDHAGDQHPGLGNIADVELRPGVLTGAAPRRNFLTTSACGVCGKASMEELRVTDKFHLSADDTLVSTTTLATMADTLRRSQRVFERTGGLHAAGVFTADGELLAVREDVGRHNAVDKVVGWALRAWRLPLAGCVLVVSGRASFELVAKAVQAGIPVLAAVSAPSSLAAQLAEESGLTLVGFLRGTSMNVYTGAQRVG